MDRLFLCTVILFLASPAVAQVNCAGQVEKPNYPPLPRQARIQGDVKVHFDVGADGKPMNVVLDGHPLLKQAVDSAINKTTLDVGCRGSLDLIYKFGFGEISDEVHTSVVFNPPNEYVITTSEFPLIADSWPVRRRSWFKRLFHL